jgi:hypothetical protein
VFINKHADESKSSGRESTFSEIVKKKKGMIIQPREEQDLKVTFQSLRDNVSLVKDNIGIRNVKPLKKGAILIECDKCEDTIKLHNTIQGALGDSYRIHKTEYQNPKIKIIGLSQI